MEDEAIQVDMNMMERAIGESRSLSFSHSDVSCSRGEMNRYMDRERERERYEEEQMHTSDEN